MAVVSVAQIEYEVLKPCCPHARTLGHMKSHILHAAAVIAPLLALGATTPASAAQSSTAVWAASNVQLVNWQTGKCLTIAGGVSTDNNVHAVQYTCDSHPSRRWDIWGYSSAYLQVKNRQTGKCLTIAGGVSTENNIVALQYTCDTHPSRYWALGSQAGQHIQFRNVQTGKCLTIAGGVSTQNNLEAVQYTCDTHPSRFWEIRDYYG